MKKLMIAVMMLTMASSALASLVQTAEPIEVGQINGAVLLSKGMGDATEDFMTISARATYGAIENLLVSLELGYTLVDVDGADNQIPITVAVQYSLPVDWPVDVAVRGELGIGDMGEASDTMSIMPAAVVSWNCTMVEWLALYAGLGYWLPLGDMGDFMDGGLAIAFGGDIDLASVAENLGMVVEINAVDIGVEGVDMFDSLNFVIGATYAF